MNREKITKINHLLTSKQEAVLGGGDVKILISKDFINDLINNKDYEVTSRNTRDFS